MSTYQAPGVYSTIVSSGNKPIESVGSSTAAFIGQSSQGVEQKATLVTSWAQYQKAFGGLKEGGHLAHAVYGFFLNGGARAYVLNVGPKKEGQTEDDIAALIQGEDKGPSKRTGLCAFKAIEDISLVAAPGMTSKTIHTMLADHASQCADRIAVLDGPEDLGDKQLHEFERIGDCKEAALYWPWISVYDESTKKLAYVPPSGHVMGAIARVDGERGVHKAPANEVVRGITGLTRYLNKSEQDLLNPFPTNINVIRDFRPESRAIRAWGARVMTSDPDYKYVPVRRLLLFIEKSIE